MRVLPRCCVESPQHDLGWRRAQTQQVLHGTSSQVSGVSVVGVGQSDYQIDGLFTA
jgi:hypothetical protein